MEWRNEPSAALADVCSPLETTVPAPDRKPPIGFDDHHRAKQHDRPICSPLVTTVPTPDRKPPIGFDDHHRAKQHDRPICSTSLKYIGAREGPKVCRLSPLEGTGFELLVRGRGEAGLSCLLSRPIACDGSVAGGATRPPRSALRDQIPIAVSELADQYLMRSVTWASSSRRQQRQRR
jgi:hypothetical protein